MFEADSCMCSQGLNEKHSLIKLCERAIGRRDQYYQRMKQSLSYFLPPFFSLSYFQIWLFLTPDVRLKAYITLTYEQH